jgi:hypothetical protein
MATTTPNYGWPVPTSTDYVKDGATAIEALGDAIDATVFGLPTGALSLVNTTTIGTTVSSIVFNDVFTATYKNYLIHINTGNSTFTNTGSLNFRLRKAGTSNSANEYRSNGFVSVPSALNNDNLVATSQVFGMTNTTGGSRFASLEMFNPLDNAKTGYQYDTAGFDGVPTQITKIGCGFHNVVDTFDGFEIIVSSGTMSGGTVRVYGYGI